MKNKPVNTKLNILTRKLHRWGAIVIALPIVIVIGSGLILQLKKDVDWIQPPTQRGEGAPPTLSFDEILRIARAEPQASIRDWSDIDRLDVRPERGIVKVRAKSRWEVQIDTRTGKVLSSTARRSDLIETIHDGSFFHDNLKLWLFLPAGVILLALWITGVYLWLLPGRMRRRARARRTQPDNAT